MIDIFSEELQEYRVKEAEEAAYIVHQLIGERVEPEYFKGAVYMVHQIINLPFKIAEKRVKEITDRKERDDFINRVGMLKIKMLDAFETRLVKRTLSDE